MRTEQVCFESGPCPEALGHQSIKLSHQTERLFQIPLLNNGCHTHCILRLVVQKKKKRVAAMGLGLDPQLCPVGKDYPLISRQQSHIMLCSDSVKIEWVSLKLI